ncbi:MAG: DUF2306 domain-containing protein [Flavobacteriales bacterium]|nr:DUF2306 domain-containing protein [Flavobacteriales bacterium]
MENLVGDTYGLIHLIVSVLALITGTFVLLMRKGTNIHKKVGYVYVFSMVVMLITSFLIYRLFNGWGVFHYFSLVSVVTILCGMVPTLFKKQLKNWISIHYKFMYWSVIGLYCALFSEILTRFPSVRFDGGLFILVGGAFLAAYIFFVIYERKWKERFKI